MSMCDDCKHNDKSGDDKPCNVCMQWVDGYLTATEYQPCFDDNDIDLGKSFDIDGWL